MDDYSKYSTKSLVALGEQAQDFLATLRQMQDGESNLIRETEAVLSAISSELRNRTDNDNFQRYLANITDNDLRDRVDRVLGLVYSYGQTGGSHHLVWVIDQIARALLLDRYREFVTDYMAGEDGPGTYSWDEGVAP